MAKDLAMVVVYLADHADAHDVAYEVERLDGVSEALPAYDDGFGRIVTVSK